jgi:hypothetical protein
MPPEDGAPVTKGGKKVPVRNKGAEAANMTGKPVAKAPRGSQVQAGATGTAAAAVCLAFFYSYKFINN